MGMVINILYAPHHVMTTDSTPAANVAVHDYTLPTKKRQQRSSGPTGGLISLRVADVACLRLAGG